MNDRVLLEVEIDESYLVTRPDAFEQGINWLRRNLAVRSVREVPAKPANEVLEDAVTACEIQAEVDGSALGRTERDHWMNVAAQLRAMDAERSKP